MTGGREAWWPRAGTLRARLTVAIVLVLVGTLIVSGAILLRTTRATLIADVDESLIGYARRGPEGEDRREGGVGPGGFQDAPVTETNFYGQPVARIIVLADGTPIFSEASGFADDPDPLPDIPTIPGDEIDRLVGRIITVSSEDGSMQYRMLVQRSEQGWFDLCALPLTEVNATLARLSDLLLVIGGIALVVAGVITWLVIRQGLRPVDHMVDTAAAIASGDMSRRVGTTDTTTELGRLGTALNAMLQQIETALLSREQSERTLRRFVGDAAHELRTPLTTVQGYAELYRRGMLKDDGAVADAIGHIENEGARMAHLVDDLLLLTRLDQQRGLDVERIDPAPLVADAVSAFRAVQPAREVSAEITPGLWVYADALRLRQVIDNLLTNARIHTSESAAVTVTLDRAGGKVRISIADRGPGIAPEDRDRIFERFWRGGENRLRSGTGSGLGLTIVASIVEAHQGTIAVHSEAGAGTRFDIDLPDADAPSASRSDGARRT